MLTILRDPEGKIEVVCEWWLVDRLGLWSPHGDVVRVSQLEVAPGTNMHKVIRPIIKNIALKAPKAIGAFWDRKHDKFARTHGFRRNQFVVLKEEDNG